jgi:HlyD family secretion protein
MSDVETIHGGTPMDRPVKRKRGLLWKWPFSAIVLAIVAAAFLAWLFMPAGGSVNVAVADIQTGQVKRAPFADYLPVRTTIAPMKTTFVGTQQGGQVEKLIVQDGVQVVAGQPLATLANPQLKLDVASREATIAGQLGDLSGQDLTLERNRLDRASQTDLTRNDLIKARRELSLRQQLHDKGLVSVAGMASFRQEFEYQQQRLAQLEAGKSLEGRIAARQASRISDARSRLVSMLETVRGALDALTVRAPVSGRLTNFDIQEGQMLKVGDPVGQIHNEADWKLVADVDEYYLDRVVVGQRASGNFDGDNNLPLVVTKVLPSVANGRFRIELGFRDNAPKGLRRGQTIDARVTLGNTEPALIASAGGWLESSGGNFIFVLDADGRTARRRVIKIGRRNPENVEILSGLSTGDRIVLSDVSAYARAEIINLK